MQNLFKFFYDDWGQNSWIFDKPTKDKITRVRNKFNELLIKYDILYYPSVNSLYNDWDGIKRLYIEDVNDELKNSHQSIPSLQRNLENGSIYEIKNFLMDPYYHKFINSPIIEKENKSNLFRTIHKRIALVNMSEIDKKLKDSYISEVMKKIKNIEDIEESCKEIKQDIQKICGEIESEIVLVDDASDGIKISLLHQKIYRWLIKDKIKLWNLSSKENTPKKP